MKDKDKPPIHIKVAGVRCIVHPNCTCYGFHRIDNQSRAVLLAQDSMIHAREIMRMQ